MFGHEKVTVLDIGANTIKIAQLMPISDGLELINFDLVKGQRAEALKEVLSRYKGNLVMAIPRHLAIVKYIRLPSPNRKELEDMIRFEAERHIPFNIDEVEFDFQVIESRTKESEILLVAVQKKIINHYIGLLNQAGFTPKVIDLSPFALFNALKYNEEDQGILALIDIGEEWTEINIIRDGILRFTRSIPIAGRRLTLSIQKELGVSLDEAERIKLSGEDEEGIQGVTKLWIDSLIKEIKRSIEIFRTEQDVARIQKIILSGGGARLSGLDRSIKEMLGTETILFDPLRKIRSNLTNIAGLELSVAIGLYLRKNVENGLKINLLPSGLRLRKEAGKRKIRAVALGLLITGLLLLGSIKGLKEFGAKQERLDFLQQRIEKLEPEAQEAKRLRAQTNIIRAYTDGRALCLEVLREITAISPDGVWLKNLSFEKGKNIQLRGLTTSYSAVSELVTILEASSYFEDVSLVYSKGYEEGDLVEFAVKASLSP